MLIAKYIRGDSIIWKTLSMPQKEI